MDENVVSGRSTKRFRKRDVGGNADGEVEETFRIPPTNQIRTLRRPSIPLELLVALGCEAQTDGVGLQDTIRTVKHQQPLRFVNSQPGYSGSVIRPKLSGTAR